MELDKHINIERSSKQFNEWILEPIDDVNRNNKTFVRLAKTNYHLSISGKVFDAPCVNEFDSFPFNGLLIDEDDDNDFAGED